MEIGAGRSNRRRQLTTSKKWFKEMLGRGCRTRSGHGKFSEEGSEASKRSAGQYAVGQNHHQVRTLTPRGQTVNEGMSRQATGAQPNQRNPHAASEAANKRRVLRQSTSAIEQFERAARSRQTSVGTFKLQT